MAALSCAECQWPGVARGQYAWCPNLRPKTGSWFPFLALTLLLSSLIFCCGCGSGPTKQTLERVRSEVATILKKDAAKIDVERPLVAQGADDLDIVEIVMALEEAFGVEIPDSALGENVSEATKTLTVQELAQIVTRQQKAK
jgi:acyl carrier protein